MKEKQRTKVLRDSRIHHLPLLNTLGCQHTVFHIIPTWVLVDLSTFLDSSDLACVSQWLWTLLLLAVSGFCNFVQNIIAFSILDLISPLSYSVSNATKRVIVVTVSLIMPHNPVTSTNVLHMMTAILGIFLYNKTKYDANQQARRHLLPISTSDLSSRECLWSPMEKPHNGALFPQQGDFQYCNILLTDHFQYSCQGHPNSCSHSQHDVWARSGLLHLLLEPSSFRIFWRPGRAHDTWQAIRRALGPGPCWTVGRDHSMDSRKLGAEKRATERLWFTPLLRGHSTSMHRASPGILQRSGLNFW